MSQSMDIFVVTNESLTAFISALESLLNVKFQVRSRQDETWYEHVAPQLILVASEHSFENDRDLNFEEYRYDISLRPINYKSEADWKQIRSAAADQLFQRLKATDRYGLMLVDDVQRKMAEFHPARSPEIVTPT